MPQQTREEREAGVPGSPGDLGGDFAGGGDGDAAAAVPAKKQTTRKPKFTTVEHMLGPNGVAYVANQIPEKFARLAKGPGHEFGDFARLVGLYREWTRRMYPHAAHDVVMRRVTALSKAKEVKMTVREFKERARMENGEGTVDEDGAEPREPADGDAPDGEDIFFPDEDDDEIDADSADGETAAFPDDDEDEWNELRDGNGTPEDDEMGILRDMETGGADARNDADATDAATEAAALKEADVQSAAFDEARQNGLDVNFDESSEDDADFEIATRTGPARASRNSLGQKGKARKIVKEPKRKRNRKKAETADETTVLDDPAEPTAGPGKRKKLGGGKAAPAAPSTGESSDSEVPNEEVRRPRRMVVASLSDSDSDDAPVRDSMGGDLLSKNANVPSATRPSFLYDSDDDAGKKGTAEAETQA